MGDDEPKPFEGNPFQSPREVAGDAPPKDAPSTEADRRLRKTLLVLTIVLLAPVALVIALVAVCFGLAAVA